MSKIRLLVLLPLIAMAPASLTVMPAVRPTTYLNKVDFHYAPPWWQTAVCLPDDPEKTLVGKEGQLLFDFNSGGVRNFGLHLQPEIVGGTEWIRQQTVSARAPIVQTWKDADGAEVLEEVFVVIPDDAPTGGPSRLEHTDGGMRRQGWTKLIQEDAAQIAGVDMGSNGTHLEFVPPERRAVVLITVKNDTPAPMMRQPELRVQSVVPLRFHERNGTVTAGDGTRISASEPIELIPISKRINYSLRLPPMNLPPGTKHQVAFAVDRHARSPVAKLSADQARRLRDDTQQWWEQAPLPWDAIRVPDAGIQSMLESSVRNIWQAREIKSGRPAFHVGPTIYRGLWVVDAAFLLESAALVGRVEEARTGIEHILDFQLPDGRIQVMDGGLYHKENGIVLWMCCRHASLTQDKAWLESIWPKLEMIVGAIRHLRERSRVEAPDLDDGLMPTGFTDGGIDGNLPEYSNVYWNLAGLKAITTAAKWLGKEDQAAQWRRDYDDFIATFRHAAKRDMLTDRFGNRYLPTVMGNAGKQYLPQRGQWAFLHGVYPGKIFPKDDPLVQGNLAMLRATKRQGLIFGMGWDEQGIWTYAASFFGHALLWQGFGKEAAQVLYDYANHAAPVRVWREEQRPVGKGAHEVGDMPHNWASAEFIRLTVHLIEIDRGDELHLLEGFPQSWAGAGMVTRLDGVPTPFGPLYLKFSVDNSGKTATLEFEPLDKNCRAVVVHLLDGTTRRLLPHLTCRVTIPVD